MTKVVVYSNLGLLKPKNVLPLPLPLSPSLLRLCPYILVINVEGYKLAERLEKKKYSSATGSAPLVVLLSLHFFPCLSAFVSFPKSKHLEQDTMLDMFRWNNSLDTRHTD